MAFNPYAADESAVENAVPEYSMPTRGSYTAPSLSEGDAYTDTFGWSPSLRVSASGETTPSAQRIGAIPRFDSRPDPVRPPVEEWRKRDADEAFRHNVESVDPTGDVVNPGITPSDRRWAPNPRSVPAAESRITSRLSPRSYDFTRPFDQLNRTHYGDPATGSARSFNGMHFSMADHRREYDVVGTMPVRTPRNTFRMEPTPWDANVVDLPPQNTMDTPSARVTSIEVPTANRSWRLM